MMEYDFVVLPRHATRLDVEDPGTQHVMANRGLPAGRGPQVNLATDLILLIVYSQTNVC